MNYGNLSKPKSQLGNYFSKQILKGKPYHESKGNCTIISEKDTMKSPIRSIYHGISKGQESKSKFKTTQNSPNHLIKKPNNIKELHDLSKDKKEPVINQNIQIKKNSSTSKHKDLHKDSIGFDQLFMNKMQKIHTKHSYSNNQLTHSNFINSNPNKISLEISQQNSQLYPKYSKDNLSKKNSFLYKRSNSTLKEEEINRDYILNDNCKSIKVTHGNSKLTSPRLQSANEQKNMMNNYNSNNKENYIQSINIKDFQTKSKSKIKKGSTSNLNSKSNQHLYVKYSNALLHNKNTKSTGVVLPFECIYSKSNKSISNDIISKTASLTKNNSRKPSAEKSYKLLNNNNNNSLIQSLEMNNYIFSNKAKGSMISTKGSASSLIKQNNEQNNNNNNQEGGHSNPFHLKGFSEVPATIKKMINNTPSNANEMLKSSQFTSTSKNFLNMNDLKNLDYISSNIKNNNSSKASLHNKLTKKPLYEMEKDFLQAKIQAIQQNKALTTLQSKHNSKSTSRVEENPINVNTKTPIDNGINNMHIGNKQSVYNINFIINTNQVPLSNKNANSGITISKYPSTANQSPAAKSSQDFMHIFNKKRVQDQKKSNKKQHMNILDLDNESKQKEDKYCLNNKIDEIKYIETENVSIDKIYNETYDSIQSTVRESAYYRHEMEKIANYIRQYHYSNGCYPESKLNFYKYGRLIGKGAFGKVNIALHICSGRLVAIKSFNIAKLKSSREKAKIKHEINALRKLQHPFVSQILDTFETDKHIMIVMEYICGDLHSFIRKRSKISENASKVIFKQIIEGLEFIHSNKIVHRDIKLDNILIDLNNTVKICDFGVSRKLNPGDIMHEHCGTLAYIAPEIFQKKGYEGYTCDIWSAGVTLYHMLSGSQPFKVSSKTNFQDIIISGKYKRIKNISEEASDLIERMLQVDPKKRITINQILSHPWFYGVNLKYRQNINLFTNAEKLLLRKFDVNYLSSNKEELVENFTIKHLDTLVEDEKHGNTKSFILAPYNSHASYIEDFSSEDIRIENGLCKFCGKVKQANIKYELNNNEDFDNGVIITNSNENEDNQMIEKSLSNNTISKPISPHVEMNDDINVISGLNSPCGKLKNENIYESSQPLTIRENIVREIESTTGYDYTYIINCLKKNEVNYATATYYLIVKDFNNNLT